MVHEHVNGWFGDEYHFIEDLEHLLFRAIKHSLENSWVPIRKFILIAYLYFKNLFGEFDQY